MNPKLPHYYAVITGDIVGSTRLTSQKYKNLRTTLSRASTELKRRFPDHSPFPLDLFRGDSWQLLLTHPADALRIGLYLRAYLRSESTSSQGARRTHVDTRFSIGVGAIDVAPTKTVGEGRGEAFRLSSELMDSKASSRMRFAISPALSKGEDAAWRVRSIVTLLGVLDVIVSRWTISQAYAVRGALLDWKQERIAESWADGAITQQAAGQHLSAAGWDGVRDAVAYYETTIKGWPAP